MKSFICVMVCALFLVNCTTKKDVGEVAPAAERTTSSEVKGAEESVEGTGDEEDITLADIRASRGVNESLSEEEQNAAFAEKLCMEDPRNCLVLAGNKTVHGKLVRKNGRYMFEVHINNQFSYECLASPGKNGKTIPSKFNGRTAVGFSKRHVVSGRKKYAGAIMPNVVWINGDYAVHGSSQVTGQRASNGCIRIACDAQFYRDAVSAGAGNVRVTVINN